MKCYNLRGLQTKEVDRNNHLNKKEIRLEGQRKETRDKLNNSQILREHKEKTG